MKRSYLKWNNHNWPEHQHPPSIAETMANEAYPNQSTISSGNGRSRGLGRLRLPRKKSHDFSRGGMSMLYLSNEVHRILS
ncbi:hypothetical protein DJ71_13415 [Halorubrum sp. E3]|nr:hypothetical protein DJ71_13415 [Halorubrum sp. E3]